MVDLCEQEQNHVPAMGADLDPRRGTRRYSNRGAHGVTSPQGVLRMADRRRPRLLRHGRIGRTTWTPTCDPAEVDLSPAEVATADHRQDR